MSTRVRNLSPFQFLYFIFCILFPLLSLSAFANASFPPHLFIKKTAVSIYSDHPEMAQEDSGRVKILNEEERKKYEIGVKDDGTLYFIQSRRPVDFNGKAKFVITEDGRLFAAEFNEMERALPHPMKHSSFAPEIPVVSAGYIEVKHGKLTYFDNKSGHYRFGKEGYENFIRYMTYKDLDAHKVKSAFMTDFDEELIPQTTRDFLNLKKLFYSEISPELSKAEEVMSILKEKMASSQNTPSVSSKKQDLLYEITSGLEQMNLLIKETHNRLYSLDQEILSPENKANLANFKARLENLAEEHQLLDEQAIREEYFYRPKNCKKGNGIGIGKDLLVLRDLLEGLHEKLYLIRHSPNQVPSTK